LAFIVLGDVKNPKRWAQVGVSVLVFAVSFVAFDRLLFTLVRQSAAHYYASMGKEAYRYRLGCGQGDGELLIFGSSRAMVALRCYFLSSRLNKRVIFEAEEGKFPRYYYYFYQKYRQSFRKPKAVLYGVDYFMFDKKSYPARLARLGKDIQLETMDPAPAAGGRFPLLSRVSWLLRKKPDIDNFLIDLLRLKNGPGVENTDLGEGGNRKTSRPRIYISVKPRRWQTFAYQKFPGVEGAYLEQLLTALERENIPVLLTIIPDFWGTNETNFEQNKFKSDIKALAARHHKVFVLDFNRSELFNLKDLELFADGGWGRTNCHLSPKGREILTRLLVPKVRQVLGETRKPEHSGKERAR
jgi:hypothetical protein